MGRVMVTNAGPNDEPTMSWPTWRLAGTVAVATFLAAGGWAVATRVGPWGSDVAAAGPAGALAVFVVALLALLVMQPWKTRSVSTWMQVWMGGTVVRLGLTPLLAYLIYSATSLSGTALALSVGLTYVLTLMAEAAVLALYVRRTV